jgi:hypothetical protein
MVVCKAGAERMEATARLVLTMAYRVCQCLLSLLPVLMMAACGAEPSAEQDALERFDTLNAQLDTLPARIDYTERNARLRATLAKGSCTEWKERGDSLHTSLLLVTDRLERMRTSMDRRPIDDVNAADSVYRANGDGERVYHDLRTFYAVALRSAADTAALKRTEGLAMQVLTFPTAEAWRQQCFAQLPRVASSTILSKISTDALLLENICLHSILKECERSVGGSPFPKGDSAGG